MTAQDIAASHLQKVITRSRAAGKAQLPTIKELARDAGVSRMTMWHALARERSAGAIESCRGRRIRLTGPSPFPRTSAGNPGGRRWRRLADDLELSALSGTWNPGGDIPAVKELLGRYGVSSRTLQRALSDLVGRRVLQRYGKGYRVPVRSGLHQGTATVVLLASGSGGVPGLPTPRSHDHIRLLESECARAGVRLSVMTPDEFLTGPEPVTLRGEGVQRLRRNPPLGVLLWRTAIAASHFPIIATFVRGLSLPTAILDETGDAAEVLGPAPWPSLRVLSMAVSPLAGEEVGRYLLSLGHRRIAFVSTHHSAWGHSAWRLGGLRTVYAAAGLPDGVREFTIGEGEYVGDLVAYARMVQDAGDLLRTSGSLLPAKMVDDIRAVADGLRESLQPVEGQPGWRSMRDLLEGVVADPGITAWVGDADPTALVCLDFLRSRGVKVPQEVSVIGLDDGMGALLRNMTSYNFNGSGAMRAMVAHVLGATGRRSPDTGLVPMELPGRIVERGTTARVPANRGRT